jgi:hypothetical protein
MNAGDKFRKETDRDDALALLALDNVRRFRKKQDSDSARIPRQAQVWNVLLLYSVTTRPQGRERGRITRPSNKTHNPKRRGC